MKRLWYLAGGIVGAGLGYIVFVMGFCALGGFQLKNPNRIHPSLAILVLNMIVFAAASMLIVGWFRREYVD